MPKGVYPRNKDSKIYITGRLHPSWTTGLGKDRELRRQYSNNYARNLRSSVVTAMGAKCVRCGFSDLRALQIDHIDGGGNAERRKLKCSPKTYLDNVLQSFMKTENRYQLLCANCNWIKRSENNEIGKNNA